MTAGLTIVDVMDAPNGFQPWFEGESWSAWKAVLKAAFALPLSDSELQVFSELSGGRAPPKKRVRSFYAIAGRRCGKDSIASLFAAFFAAVEQAHLGRLRPGEVAFISMIACDRDQAKIVEGYTRAFFTEIPDLRRMVTRETRNGLELSNRISLSIQTNSYRQARGRTLLLAILDELAHYRDENSASPDVELHRAIMPSLMTLPGSMLVGISTPYRKAGLLYEMYRDHFGKDTYDVLVIQARSDQLNPTLDPAMIAAEREADPAAAVSEWDGRFREDLSSYVSIELIESAVDQGVYVRPPRPDVSYFGAVDSATGVGEDSYTAAVAHRDGELIVLDALYEKTPPFSPAAVVTEIAALFRAYGVSSCVGDKFGAGLTLEMYAQNRVEYSYAELDRSQFYIAALPLFSSGRVRLLDNRKMVVQFASLERRTSAIGRDVVNHPDRRHDDAANACAIALWRCATGGDDFVREFVQAWGHQGAELEYDRQQAARRRALTTEGA